MMTGILSKQFLVHTTFLSGNIRCHDVADHAVGCDHELFHDIDHRLRFGHYNPTRPIGLIVMPFSLWRGLSPYGSE
jgi:hypothetical protein